MRTDRASSTILKEGEHYARNPNYSRDYRSGDYCNPVVAILSEGFLRPIAANIAKLPGAVASLRIAAATARPQFPPTALRILGICRFGVRGAHPIAARL